MVLKKWYPVEYGSQKYKYWSEKVHGEGDKDLPESAETRRKFIILRAEGTMGTAFSVGFSSKAYRKTEIFDAGMVITTKEGVTFYMGLDQADCDFFVASNNGEISLSFVKYTDINDPILESLQSF